MHLHANAKLIRIVKRKINGPQMRYVVALA